MSSDDKKDYLVFLQHVPLTTKILLLILINDFPQFLLSYVMSNSHLSEYILYSYYCKTSSISHTKSQSLNVSCILAQLCSLNPLKPGVKLRMKM